jgi:hypothetical protein
MSQKPTVGRAVYFHDGTPTSESDASLQPCAGIITKLWDKEGRANLVLFLPCGDAVPCPNVLYSETPEPGCWSWPPRV